MCVCVVAHGRACLCVGVCGCMRVCVRACVCVCVCLCVCDCVCLVNVFHFLCDVARRKLPQYLATTIFEAVRSCVALCICELRGDVRMCAHMFLRLGAPRARTSACAGL